MSTKKPIYLLHTQPCPKKMAVWSARHHTRHARQSADTGDVMHGLLRAAFGDAAPQPFRYFEDRNGLLAYTSLDARAIDDRLAKSDPAAIEALGLDSYKISILPSRWKEGQILGFDVRVRPTVRSRTGTGLLIKGHACEQDAFLVAVREAGGPDGERIDRSSVYEQWLRNRVNLHRDASSLPWQGAAEILDVQVSAFQINDAVRRTKARGGGAREKKAISGPDAVLSGTLRVTDPAAFNHLLARGIGRHRSFGFGMLLLRPA